MHKCETTPLKMHQVFNKQFEHIDQICDAEKLAETKGGAAPQATPTVLKLIKFRRVKPLKIGQPRELIQ